MAYPQGLYISRRGFQWLSLPSLGRSLFVLGYCILITVMLTTNSILPFSDAYYYEKIGFRAAWISLMQVPLIILLAGKVNIIGMLIGTSYERLNWLHRWISRILLVSVAVHAGFFLREWIRADFLSELLQIMPVVKYGMAAGGLLLWMNLSGIAPVRHAFYEFWVIQHLISIAVFLWLLYKHVPAYAMFYVWMSVAFITFDRSIRMIWGAYRNFKVRSGGSVLKLADRVGYRTELYALPGETTRVVLKNVPFTWTPGQHLYIWIPRIGFLETHPFTISNISSDLPSTLPPPNSTGITSSTRTAALEIRAHSGFSRRLFRLASKHSATSDKPLELRSFIQGPFGSHPEWNTFESLVLISASTGASFTLPILESILADPCCVRKCHFILLVRKTPQCSCYLHRLRVAARSHRHPNLIVSIHVAVTGTDDGEDGVGRIEGELQGRCCCGPEKPGAGCMCGSDEATKPEGKRFSTMSVSDDDTSSDREPALQSCCAPVEEEPQSCCAPVEEEPEPKSCCQPSKDSETRISVSSEYSASNPQVKLADKKVNEFTTSISPVVSLSTSQTRDVQFVSRRPMLSHTIRTTVEEARGETCVVVCGGKELSGSVRNEVARLSDERAVHKGTGAQGIRLWVEEFGF
jgi:NAD(P)H-flavin reductase